MVDPRADRAFVAKAAALALALAACEGSAGSGAAPPACFLAGPSPAPVDPLAHIGPDVRLEIACGAPKASAPVATISNAGGRTLEWSASVPNDGSRVHFAVSPPSGKICPTDGTVAVMVDFAPGDSAQWGDTFETTLTFEAAGNAFPTATVDVHAVVVEPSFTIQPTELDFGVVSPDAPLTFRRTVELFNPQEVELELSVSPASPSVFGSGPSIIVGRKVSARFPITVDPRIPGDYTEEWRVTASTLFMHRLPETCGSTRTLKLHARVVEPADASAD